MAALRVAVGGQGVLLMQGDRSWVVDALGAVVVPALGLPAMIAVVHWRGLASRLRAMGCPKKA